MNPHQPIEWKLVRALEADLSTEARAWLDSRMADVMSRPVVTARRLPRLRLLLRPLPLIAAFLLLTGAVAGALGLLERIATEGSPGWRVAWENAAVIDATVMDAGYAVTLERAYADLNQVVTFVSVRGPEQAMEEDGSAIELHGGLLDPSGQALDLPFGTSVVETDLAVVVNTWGPPAAQVGTYVLTISEIQTNPSDFTEEDLPSPVTGEWRFEFELPEPAGTIVFPDATATDQSATIELAELVISPTMIIGRMYLRMDDGTSPVWVPTIESVRVDGTELSTDNNANMIGIPLREEGRTGSEFRTAFGADVASGSWEIEISQITLPELQDPLPEDGDPPMAPPVIDGSWTLLVEVP